MAYDPQDPRLPELFREKFEVNEGTGCWEWVRAKNQSGYGMWTLGIRFIGTQMSHRISFLALTGKEIPEEYTIDHLCRVRNCVNPEHLEAVPHWVNTARGETIPAANAAKTHCIRGHEFNEWNSYLYTRPNGRVSRNCRTCLREKRGVKNPRIGTDKPSELANRCKKGHEFSEENTYRRPDTGVRSCRACARNRKLQKEVAA